VATSGRFWVAAGEMTCFVVDAVFMGTKAKDRTAFSTHTALKSTFVYSE
jgi:hypothetical protein